MNITKDFGTIFNKGNASCQQMEQCLNLSLRL
jgi:hypothetical protein